METFRQLFETISIFRLNEMPFVIISLVVGFTVHEFAHAYVAYRFGDHTAKDQGRLTLNPAQHLDPAPNNPKLPSPRRKFYCL